MNETNWTAAALELRAAYILEHAAAIYVRVQNGVRWENYALSELHGAEAIREAFRLLLREEMPVRKLREGEQGENESKPLIG